MPIDRNLYMYFD